MNYQRILVLIDLGTDPRPAMSALRRLASSAARVSVIAQQPVRQFAWLTPTAPPDLNDAARRALDELREAAQRVAPEVEVVVAAELPPDALADAVASSAIDLVVVSSPPLRRLPALAELRKRSSVPLLWVGSSLETASGERGNRLLCVGLSARGLRAVLAFLRDHAGPADRAVLRSSGPLSPEDLFQLRGVSGIAPDVELIAQPPRPWRDLIDPEAGREVDLVVLPRFPPAAPLGVTSGPPLLILPPPRPAAHERDRAIDLPDLVDDGALIRVRLEDAVGVGRRTPIADQELAFVHGREVVARASSRHGEVELPSGVGESLGVFRTHGSDSADPLASIEQRVAVLRATPRAIVLFDAEMGRNELSLVRFGREDPVGVRVRPTRSCGSLRSKLRAAGLPPLVIDAGAVLGEGDARDVPALADAVRLARTAARMRAAGFPVAAIVYLGPHKPVTEGFAAVRPEEVAQLPALPIAAVHRSSLADRLDMTTASVPIPGNSVEVELDNAKARRWLLSAINGSRQRVHFQVYMAFDDDVGRSVEAALAAAGARGVAVRVLVDSLHGLHGSFGARNPILDRLSSRPGVELRVSKPITGPPSLADLKQRDHRKLVIVDGKVALLGGRNLSHEYYIGFDEVPLTPETTWRMVPWLDAGARVEGPAVVAVERSFLEAWTDAGGARFDTPHRAPAGATTARVIVHRGLRDAHTVEAYLAMIETARSHIYAVNGFPLLLEIQHALLRALRRGVRVRTLFGNLTPRHGDEPFKGPWAVARTAATALVHSRMDALVAAGGECYELVVRRQPAWEPGVGDVRPHVHAKAMSADGRVCAVGSANLDITAGYWESELLLVVEDETIARAVEARFDELIAGSQRVDRDDPDWRRRAEQREWMRNWPGVLSV